VYGSPSLTQTRPRLIVAMLTRVFMSLSPRAVCMRPTHSHTHTHTHTASSSLLCPVIVRSSLPVYFLRLSLFSFPCVSFSRFLCFRFSVFLFSSFLYFFLPYFQARFPVIQPRNFFLLDSAVLFLPLFSHFL
jgi:hypothetical protein